MNVREQAKKVKQASGELLALDEATRVKALKAIADALIKNTPRILAENKKDLDQANQNKLSNALIDRLSLSDKSLKSLSDACLAIAQQPQVVATVEEEYKRPNGLTIQKQRVPIGVIGMIFESRPNVVVDGAALAIKSGNAIILKGGKEASFSNAVLFSVTQEAIKGILPRDSVMLIQTRDEVNELLKLNEYIDLMVPRGGSELIRFVREHATMPVVAHDKGLCHLYVHKDAKVDAEKIVLNAKVQRPGVCNALESLILHEAYPNNKKIIDSLIQAGVEVRGDEKTMKLNSKVKKASDADYATEFLDKIISVSIVSSESQAIDHIKKYSSHHTEAILSEDSTVIEKFLNSLDASCLVVNSSTRFNDGGELGLGAELGISTSKLHAYGPMGAKEMTTTRFIVLGQGQIRN